MLVPSIVKCLPAGTLAIHRPDGFVKGKQEGNGPKDERATMVLASKVKLDLRFELCNLNYRHIHVHIACNSQCLRSFWPPNGLGGQI